MIDKFVRSVAEALAGIKDGSTVLIAGFAQVGEPRALIEGLIETGAKELTVVHNTAGRGREGVARLIGEGRVRKIVCSFARSRGSVLFEEVYARGGIELEILPQGTMAERMRAAAAGIPAFYTATGAGTKLGEGKEPVTLRLDRDILAWFRQRGRGYQTRINAVLRAFVEAQKQKG